MNLIVDFGSATNEAFALRTEAAFAALVACDARSEAVWAPWTARSEAAGSLVAW